MQALTVEQFQATLPAKMKKSVNQELIDQVNAVLTEPDFFEQYRENLISYTSVMMDGKFTIEQYLNAVKYCSHKLLGCTNIDAYIKTFSVKHAAMVANGVTAKDIASYVTAYNKSKLVNLIMAQTLVPTHVLNADLYQRALNVQADLMMNAKSEKVRSDAAAHLMGALKMPEVIKVEMDIGVKESSAIDSLRQTTMELSRQQQMMIQAGAMNAQDVAHSKLVIDMGDAEVVS